MSSLGRLPSRRFAAPLSRFRVIPPETIEQVRDAADIVALIGEHVELKRTGSDWRGPCPFHGGTHRNFSVVPRKQMYHCFVCHESGDVFTFWMKRFGLDYPSAVREIAGKVGIAVPETRDRGSDPNEPLYSALGVAAEWFQKRLREMGDAAPAREYLERRGLSGEAWDEFGLGYAPAPPAAMLEAFHALGLEDEVLLAAGLALKREEGSGGSGAVRTGELVPRFRGRLLFPIADIRGRIAGFGGRIIGEGEPKYLNSPDSAVFHKGTLLYLLDRARGAIRTEGHAIVVEGYVDAIRLHLAGITGAVAPLGTALTGEQARVLRRYTKHVYLAYDADQPGLKSTFRAGDALLSEGVAVGVITLPVGEDPDSLVVKGGAAAFRELLSQAVDIVERKLQLIERKGLLASLEGRRRALDRLLPTMRAAADPITRELYLSRVAEKTGVAREVLEREVGPSSGQAVGRTGGRAVAGPEGRLAPTALPPYRLTAELTAEIPAEKDLVRLMLWDPIWVSRVGHRITPDEFHHPAYRALAGDLLAGRREPSDPTLAPEWERLSEREAIEPDREAMFADAVDWLAERRVRDRLREIERLLPVAQGEQKGALESEKRTLLDTARPRRYWKVFRS